MHTDSTVDEAIRAITPTRPARLADELIQPFGERRDDLTRSG